MEVKRYKQTKEKLRRRRERLLHKVRLLAGRAAQPGPALDAAIKVGLVAPGAQIDLVDSETDSEAESEEAAPPAESPVPAPPPAPAPAPVAESPPAAAPVDADEVARKIKEQFRSSMARVMVQHLNPYRHSDAKAGRITCTADFKHLARKVRGVYVSIKLLPTEYFPPTYRRP